MHTTVAVAVVNKQVTDTIDALDGSPGARYTKGNAPLAMCVTLDRAACADRADTCALSAPASTSHAPVSFSHAPVSSQHQPVRRLNQPAPTNMLPHAGVLQAHVNSSPCS